MGWSCSSAAAATLRRIDKANTAAERRANEIAPGVAYELGREQADGAIVGALFDIASGASRGRFRIDPDGTVVRPERMKELAR